MLDAFKELFDTSPDYLIRAPSGVNIIGEHMDCNDSYVLPIAFVQANWIGLRPRKDGRVYLRSLEKVNPANFALNDIKPAQANWFDYVKGMVVLLQ